ncbi:MAG: hypothetical protein FJY88_09725, partial [Candidatus Eisenbacteria bacterium]|nr:hypothetical protein [Candidatus Eisenbacteria bacterium]
MSLIDRMLSIDRRWIYLVITVAVVVPLFLDLPQRISVTPEVRGLYEAVEQLPRGSKVLLACDYDPGS